MKGDQVTLSTGAVISLGLRSGSVVAHVRNTTLAENRGVILTRPVAVDDLAGSLGLELANLLHGDVVSLEQALAKIS